MYTILLDMCTRHPINYYDEWRVTSIPDVDQFLMCLMKLRRNFSHTDLAVRFAVSERTVSNIVMTWLSVLHDVLFVDILKKQGIPSLKKNQTSMPTCFSSFTNCRIILDCTEVQAAVPRSSMSNQSCMFSHYKQRITLKCLVGVAPNGTITFVSDLYPGSFSDKAITEHTGVLKMMQPGDLVLADKGFLVQDMLPQGVSLNVPPFLVNNQFTKEQVQLTTRIARARIHVERAIKRIKDYKILDFIPAHYRSHSSKIFQVCACMVNMQNPLIKNICDSLCE